MSKKYPIAEIFTSIQGEGVYTGQVMTFIRLAGCSIGKKMTLDEQKRFHAQLEPHMQNSGTGNILPIMPEYTEKCTLFDGREFACDTDFRTKEVLEAVEINARVPAGVNHVCITGGEPLMHDLTPLIDWLEDSGHVIHIETSGTIDIRKAWKNYRSVPVERGGIWLTVAPKKDFLDSMIMDADEIKILIDEDFNPESPEFKRIDDAAGFVTDHLYVQPVNFEHELNQKNMDLAKKFVMEHSQWKLSLQLHKVLSVR